MTSRAADEPIEVTVAKHGMLLGEHGRMLGEIKQELNQQREGNGEIAEMFGKIMAATTHTADQVVVFDTTLRTHAQQVDRRLTELKVDQDRICALKHGAIEQRLSDVETGKENILKKVEDMGENTKITYIRRLEGELNSARSNNEAVKVRKFEWSKLWFTAVVGLLVAIASVMATYALSHKTPVAAPAQSSPVATK